MSDIQHVRITHVVTGKSLFVTDNEALPLGKSCDVSALFAANPIIRKRGDWQWNSIPNTGELHGFLNTFSNGRLWFGEHDEQADARAAISWNSNDSGTIDDLSIVAEPLGNNIYYLKWNSGTVEWDNYGNNGDGYLFIFPEATGNASKVFWARKEDHPADDDSFKFKIESIS